MIAGITEKEQKIIERILNKYRKDYAFFYYGSRVKGTYEKTSDLDVLVKGKAEMPLAVLQEIKEEFDKSDLPYIVNFSDYYKLDSSFYERIKPDIIPYKWQEVKLGDFLIINPSERLPKGTIAKKVSMEKLQPFSRDVSGYELDEFSGGAKFRNKDTIMARITPCLENGKRAQINILKQGEVGFGSTEFIVFREKGNISDANFIYYLVCSDLIRSPAIKSMVGSSGRQRVQTDVLENLRLFLPPLEVQKKIAGVLGALDDKIELNNKINQNLEAQAQALFKSWFVDFEPFGGKMPDDWKIKTIGDVCASISETYNRKDENVVLINTSDVLNGEILTHSLVKNENLKGQFKKTFQKNDILYSEIRPINKRFAFVDIENTYNYIASTKLMVIRPDTSKISPLILYRILKSQDLIDELQHLAETRSGTFPQITFASELAIQKIVLAPLNEQKIISNVLEVLENKIRKNIQENLRLAELRDTLLPKLMSGEINVDDVKILADKSSFTGEI